MADTPFQIQNTNNPPADKAENPLYTNADYAPILSNWFTAKPYGFRFTPKSGPNQAKVMYLPIGPSNLTITTHFATNLIPTIYGTVEEHSPVRYYDIVIEGTTGMAPKYTDPISSSELKQPLLGRSSFPVQQILSADTQGFYAKTLAAADKIFTDTKALFGQSGAASTGVQLDQTGYVAFHNLYRFFLKYKKDVSGTDRNGDSTDTSSRDADLPPPLVFFNYKDNNEYSVVIKSFVLRRDKENPMLYFYSIILRGYDLTGLNDTNGAGDTQNKRLQDLGLNGVKSSTFLGDAKEKADQARGILSSVANGANSLGR